MPPLMPDSSSSASAESVTPGPRQLIRQHGSGTILNSRGGGVPGMDAHGTPAGNAAGSRHRQLRDGDARAADEIKVAAFTGWSRTLVRVRAFRAAEMPMREKRYEAFKAAAPKIRALLTPEQQKRYDRITDHANAEWERRTETGTE
jgi:hypothetical protein